MVSLIQEVSKNRDSSDIRNHDWSFILDESKHVNERYDLYTESMSYLIDKHSVMTRKRIKAKSLPWFTAEVHECFKNRNNAMRRFSRSRLSSDFSEYKFLRNKARALLCAAKKNYFLQKIYHNSDSASVWKTVHEITGNRKQKSHITELVSAENSESLDICDALATDFIVKPTENSSGDLSLPPVPESPDFSWVTPQSIQTA